MAKRDFYIDIDMNGNQILESTFEHLSAAPSNPFEGQNYYDTTLKINRHWNGTQWISGGGGGGTSMTPSEIKAAYESNPDTNAFTDAYESKLNGIQAGATANSTDAQLRDRSTHTGTQAATTITEDSTHRFTNDTAIASAAQVISDLSAHESRTDNPHSVSKSQLNLENVDNTSDLNKPVSNAQQTALNLKEDKENKVTNLNSPNNTTYPTTQTVVDAIAFAVASIVSGAPNALDTLLELSAALGNDANFATTVTNLIAQKVDKVTGKGLSTEDYTTAEKTKLSGIASGATANSSDATLLARANHTGTQAISTVSGLQTALDAKQTRENWMQLNEVNTFRTMFNY